MFQGHYEIPALVARSYLERAAQLIDLKRFDEASVDAQKVIKLKPLDPRSHLTLGLALSHTTQLAKARLELEESIRLAESITAVNQSTKQSAQQELEHLP